MDCQICEKPAVQAETITGCGHMFCANCLRTSNSSSGRSEYSFSLTRSLRCPQCQTEYSDTITYPLLSQNPINRKRGSFRKGVPLYECLSEMLILVVGPPGSEQQKIVVHKLRLTAESSFFETACKPEWMKPEKHNTIDLPIDCPKAVKVMVNWVYEDSIYIPKDIAQKSLTANHEGEAIDSIWGLLAKVFVLADKYNIAALKNDAIDGFLQILSLAPFNFGIIPFVYENTLAGSPLRKLVYNVAKSKIFPMQLEELKESGCTGFFYEMSMGFVEKLTVVPPHKNPCQTLHEHPDSTVCAGQSKWLVLGI